MKTKAYLFLAVSLAAFLGGGLVMNCMVQAQQHRIEPYVPTISVVQAEDPLRRHGKQIETIFVTYEAGQGWQLQGGSGVYAPIVDVPEGRIKDQFLVD